MMLSSEWTISPSSTSCLNRRRSLPILVPRASAKSPAIVLPSAPPGGRNVAALSLSSALSNRVARPYARLLATRNACSHFIGGNPGDRLRAAGFGSYNWAENIGCRDAANPFASVLGTHLFYQSERPYNGGHYRNLMNPDFTRVGIGVWHSGGNGNLVIDFYHP